MNTHYIIESCGCGNNGQICVVDEQGEDCNAWSKLKELKEDAQACKFCGRVPKFNLITA